MSGSSGPDPYAQSRAGGATGTTNAGPHDSNVANKLDPRVDSDMGKLEVTTPQELLVRQNQT